MHISLVEPAGKDAWTTGQIFVPLDTARYVVISDIDDTIMRTGVASKLKMLWRLFFQNAESREALPGAAIFCRALHEGLSGKDWNPMLYVSRGPWTIYEMLELFFNIHNIPVGPILFLREWGLTLQRPFPPRARDHKLRLIRNMLSLYKGYPFVLIGDSGQHDPEIYARIVRENPDRVKAIYIRNVNRDPARRLSIEKLAKEVMEAGSSLLLAEDSFAMARHAAAHHLISSKALGEILQELESREEKPTLARPRKIGSSSAGLNQASAKELKEVLEKQAIEGSHGVPVEIEPKEP
jgi:phosphatidate phosphatase APP1